MQTRLVIIIVTTLGLVLSLGTLTTLYSQNTFAQNSNTVSHGAGGGSGGAMIGTVTHGAEGGAMIGGDQPEVEEDQLEI